ncbi:MAG: hypothetical protein DRI89_09290 [Bacteroidetes bacterium]|nr:MAG: hypothetical protein DRI89_09290 [Bacteroidota bacterium]
MKSRTQYKYIIKKATFAFLLIAFSLFSFKSVSSQITNLNLPDIEKGGKKPYDILAANNLLFVHIGSKIIVYNASTRTYKTEILLYTKDYGKFNPAYYDKKLHGKSNLMAYDNINNELYVVTLELDIKRYAIDTSITLIDSFPRPPEINNFKPLHGLNVLKFDAYNGPDPNRKSRLYWVVKGRDDVVNSIGGFHARERYFAIFELVEDEASNATKLVQHYKEYVKSSENYNESAISDVEYHRNPDSNYFFLTKLEKFEMWKITETGVQLIKTVLVSDEIPDPANFDRYRFIRMLYIYDLGGPGDTDDIHKIVAIPYTYPSRDMPIRKMLVYDVDDRSVKWVPVPSRRTMDAAYLSANNDLILSYSPDPDEISDGNIDNTDIAIFHYNPINKVFTRTQTLVTNQVQNKSEYDLNASFQVTKINASTALIAKKDQIVKLYWDENASKYKADKLIEAEGNYFSKTTTTATRSFIINRLGQEIKCFNNGSYITHGDIHMGYPVSHIVSNTEGSKMYMFQKLNSEKNGLCVYDINVYDINGEEESMENLNHDEVGNNDINGMIGDVVYNPYKKQFLVAQSNFAENTYFIKIINDDADNTSPGVIPLPSGLKYPKEMYIGPNKRLYVMANMQSSAQNPKVCVYAADDMGIYNAYDPIYNEDITFSGNFADKFEYWSAQFSYNAANNKVYATIHPTEYTFDPYVSVSNSMFNYDEPVLTNGVGNGTGSIIRFDDSHIQSITNDFLYPGKIICPNETSGGTGSQYADKIFIIGEDFYEYDFVNPTNTITHTGFSYNDIIYSPEMDMLFALKDVKGENIMDRRIQIDKIYYDEGELQFEQIDLDGDGEDGWIAGQAAGFFYNPYDMHIYIHLKFDNKKLGGTNVSLFKFDPMDDQITVDAIDLEMTSFYPELDHCNDYHWFFYSFNQPYINPYNNKVYLPNGAHSKVSVVDFVPREPLFLNPVNNKNQSFNWVSFPRLNRNGDDPKVNDVLGGVHIAPNNYEDNSQLENLPPNAEVQDKVYNVYTNSIWPDLGSGLKKVYSPRGYILTLEYEDYQEGIEPHLYLDGTVINPGTAINKLYGGKENWTGYWLYATQDIFDALGDAVDDLYMIKHQDWLCLKGVAPWLDPEGATPPPPLDAWSCDKRTRNIRYGEMVILKTEEDINGFQWNIGGLAAAYNDPSQNPAYFTYTEQATYTPLLVELDNTDQAIEIGAFVSDSCVGATVVNPGDSIVVIRAYMENGTSDSVSFQMYYGTKSTVSNRISSYYVWDRHIEAFSKRVLHANEKEDYYFISLREQKEKVQESDLISTFVIWPNPSLGILFYSIVLEEDAHVTISLFDITGKLLAIPLDEPLPSGNLTGELTQEDDTGGNLLPGVYFVQLKTGDVIETKKVIVN